MSDNKEYLIEGHYYQYDLQWLIDKLLSFEESIKTVIDLQTIHYADPIQWNITTQYSPNTVVVDPNNGTAYMSKQAVPAGVQLTNEDYWVVIFNYQQIYEKICTGVAYNNKDSAYATKDFLVNDLVWYNLDLYRVTRAISTGGQLIPGTNLTPTSIESLLSAYYGRDRTAQLMNDTVNVTGDYTLNAGDIATTSTNRTIKITKDNEVDVDGNDSLHVDGTTTINRGGYVSEVNGGAVDKRTVGAFTETFNDTATSSYEGKRIVNGKETDITNENISVTTNAMNITVNAKTLPIKFEDITVDLHNISSYGTNVKNYGARGDGTTDDTTAIKDALAASNGLIYFPAGTYLYTDSLYLTSNSILFFDNCKFTAGTPKPLFVVDYGTSDISFYGRCEYDSNEKTTGGQTYDYRTNCGFLSIGNADNVDFDCNVMVNMSLYAHGMNVSGHIFQAHHANNIKIGGEIKTHDSTILFAVGCSNLEVYGVNATYTLNTPPDPVIMDNDVDLKGHTFNNVYIHDCYIDGGSVLKLSPINIGRSNSSGGEVNPLGQDFDVINNINIRNCTIKNILEWGDGIDILECINVRISDCYISVANEGIVICSTAVTVTNCTVESCRGLGIALGDPNIGYNWGVISISNCTLIGNGVVDSQFVYPANIGICEQDGYNISSVFIDNCQCINTGNTKYGFYCLTNTGGTAIVLSNNRLSGSTSAVYSLASEGVIHYYNNYGFNPRGIMLAPTVSTDPVRNNFGSPCRVFINNGDTEQALMINGQPIATLHANESYEFMVGVSETTHVSTSVTGVTWAWACL